MKPYKFYQIHAIFFFLTFVIYSINAQSAESLISPFTGSELLGTYEARFDPLTLLVEPLGDKNYPSSLVVK